MPDMRMNTRGKRGAGNAEMSNPPPPRRMGIDANINANCHCAAGGSKDSLEIIAPKVFRAVNGGTEHQDDSSLPDLLLTHTGPNDELERPAAAVSRATRAQNIL